MELTSRQREHSVLSFGKPEGRGPVMETFYPWDMTIDAWKKQGLPDELADIYINKKEKDPADTYFGCAHTGDFNRFEAYFGFDSIHRIFFNLPFLQPDEELIEDNEEFKTVRDKDGWIRQYYKTSDMVKDLRPAIINESDWRLIKKRAENILDIYYSDKNIKQKYGAFSGITNSSIRLALPGFFWAPRDLLGIEQHMTSFYDKPELLHEINDFILGIYLDRLTVVLETVSVDVLYIMEDLSGKNGPMLSPKHFDEFVGSYYRKLVPFLKSKGVGHVLVDTDGDFNVLIPNLLDSGIDGFLPMDVNAGMDIVKVREKFPKVKFIGGFNKLVLEQGEQAIDREFERILPVIRQGGYIPGNDHQVSPGAPMKNYIYYIDKLKKIMQQSGADIL